MSSRSASDDKDSVAQSGDERAFNQMWSDLLEEWLRTRKTQKTREAYTFATHLWQDFLATDCTKDGKSVHPWNASPEHALQWRDYMLTTQSGIPAVTLRLEACNSWYNYLITWLANAPDGFQDIFRDSEGNIRTNPFRRDIVQRPKNVKKDKVVSLSLEDVIQLLNYLASKRHTRIGSRNYALVLTFIITGWHPDKILSLTWRDIRPQHDQTDEDAPLSRRCYDAILDHLRRVGRDPEHMLPEEYVWQPVAEHTYHNLNRSQNLDLPSNRPVSEHNIAVSIRRELHAAGVPNSERCSVGNLSSTHGFLEDAAYPNSTRLQELLQQTHLATTCIIRRED